MEVSPSTHNLCVSEDLLPIRNANNQLILISHDDPTNTLIFLDETPELLQRFGLIPDDKHEDYSEETRSSITADSSAKWKDDDAVKHLIYLRHTKLKTLFSTMALSNQRKWEKLSQELRDQKLGNKYWDFTWKQCEAKYKDLKKQYNKAKDNQGDRCSGEQPIPKKKCRFYDEMDEVCHKSPTVNPVSKVSSLKPLVSPSPAASSSDSNANLSTNEDESYCNTKKDPKKTRMESEVKGLREAITEENAKQEEARERRHREFMTVYESVMNRLIDKL